MAHRPALNRAYSLGPPSSECPPAEIFGLHSNNPRFEKITYLFEHLKSLKPMNKRGPMSGSCSEQTHQMQNFLKKNFEFRNIPGEVIVPGVAAFKVHRPVESIPLESLIHFPSDSSKKRFSMSVQEIRTWQKTYHVYADADITGMTKEFLQSALRGRSTDGEEAFRMKFVVRISTCPIFMDFDGEILNRAPHEFWPNRIKLVSVTGIDFAARKHDYGDIFYYIKNWRDVFECHPQTGSPLIVNGRDMKCRSDARPVDLHSEHILRDLKRMAKLRLIACDRQRVNIVVETGIGLGVFAGRQWGIDESIRKLSARAIRTVLEEDGAWYRNIQAIVFALPIFDQSGQSDVYHAFVNEFSRGPYRGSIPVLIIDQDMHRLTVAIAKEEYSVSQLNPADSHGVFGEYWQNFGPAVEEKLALTTAGLLVQHHLINREVINTNNYFPLHIPGTEYLDWKLKVHKDEQQRASLAATVINCKTRRF